MNLLNFSENPLPKWTPRRPSARLKARLFAPAPARSALVLNRPGWGWLAPAAGTLLLTFFLLGSSLNHWSASPHRLPPGLLASIGGSNATAWGPYLSQHDGDRNVLTTILEWTNSDYSHLSMGALLLNTTNRLRN